MTDFQDCRSLNGSGMVVPWRGRVGAWLGAALLLLTGCGTLSTFQSDHGPVEARRYASSGDLRYEVDTLVGPLLQQDITPGVVVGVLTADGGEHFFSYGQADKASGAAMQADTLFPIGSLSKGFLGVMAAQLVAQGRLSWDDTLGEVLPDAERLSADARKITVHQLATHTSGLPRQPFTERTLAYFVGYLFTGNSFYRHFDRAFVLDYLADFKAPAQRQPQYSNIGFGLLGEVLERRSGMRLEVLLQRQLQQPLGLPHTGYLQGTALGAGPRASGYAGDQPKFIRRGQPVPDWEFTDLMKGSAAMYSSARDLLRFAGAHLGQGLPAAVVQDTLRIAYPRVREAAAVAWVCDQVNDQRIYYQVGLVAGYTSFVGLDPRHGLAVVVLQNSFNWSANIGYRLLLRLGSAQTLAAAT